jgi:aminopeptidase YwaD
MHHLSAVLAIGERPIGSPANQAAANYIRKTFQSAGLDVEEQPYPCTGWEHTSTRFAISGRSIPAQANAFSLPCDAAGAVLPVSTLAELEAADIAGRIVLFYGDLTRQPVAPLAWFLSTERDRRIIERLHAARPAALLCPPAATLEYEQVTEDWALDVAAATIPQEAVVELLANPRAQASLQIEARRYPAVARNIVARRRFPDSQQRVVLCAHFDTKINTPGASDNAAGVAALLCLAEECASREYPFDLEFVAFNGEEYLPVGDDEYVRRAGDTFDQILLAINIDGAGPILSATSIAVFSASSGFEAKMDDLIRAYPGVVKVDPWPESNHSTFSFRGVPSLAISSMGARNLAHTPADRLEIISPARLLETAQLVEDILASLKPGSYRPESN